MRHHERGQLFPLWAASIFAMAAFTFFVMNVSYVMKWHIRAQTAADGIAHAVLSAQVERYNSINLLLFASSIEEIRTRHLIGDLTLLARRSGDCTDTITADEVCPMMYAKVYPAFRASVDRYTDDVKLMGQLTSAGYPKMVTTAQQFVNAVNTGGVPDTDPSFRYTLLNYGPRVDPVRGAFGTYQDALAIVPGAMGNSIMNRQDGGTNAFWAPPEDEILTCAIVPPMFSMNLFGYKVETPSVRVYGRAAATASPGTNEWVSPGMIALNDPGSPLDGTVLVPAESWDAPGYDSGDAKSVLAAGRPSYQNDGWYDLTYDDYASTPNTPSTKGYGAMQLGIQGHTFITAVNWWTTSTIATYLGKINLGGGAQSAACGG